MIDIIQLTMERIFDLPEGWKWYKGDYDAGPKGFIQVWGSVPIGKYKSGPRKGQTKWGKRSSNDIFWVALFELDKTIEIWEAENGLCHKCEGSGVEVKSSGINGKTFRKCGKCNAQGIV